MSYIKYKHCPKRYFQHCWELDNPDATSVSITLKLHESTREEDGQLNLSSTGSMSTETADKVIEMLEQGIYVYKTTQRENRR